MSEYFPPLTTAQMNNELHTPAELKALAKSYAPTLKIPSGDNAWAFLWAICGNESSFGTDIVAKSEFSWDKGGVNFKKSKTAPALRQKYGAPAACSYGPWQILYFTAYDLGYGRPPGDLWSAFISLPWVVQYFNSLRARGAHTVELMAAAYNGGPGVLSKDPKDWNDNVKKYVAKFRMNYDTLKSKLIE